MGFWVVENGFGDLGVLDKTRTTKPCLGGWMIHMSAQSLASALGWQRRVGGGGFRGGGMLLSNSRKPHLGMSILDAAVMKKLLLCCRVFAISLPWSV